MKPENVLISIDDVESIIEAELAAQSATAKAAPTRLVGVPPSRGRGGNQTPRSESVFITGSQPLPSPSSSYGSSSHLDLWAFSMSKIDGEASKPESLKNNVKEGSTNPDRNRTGKSGSDSGSKETQTRADSMEQAAERISNVTLDASPFGEKVRPGKAKAAGPSLLSRLAPGGPTAGESSSPRQPASSSNPPPYSDETAREPQSDPSDASAAISSSAMSVDGNIPLLDGTEKITVKIADLGNGEFDTLSISSRPLRRAFLFRANEC